MKRFCSGLGGKARAKRAPDSRHPFGYGRELYFWAFDAGRGELGWWQAVRRSKDPAGFIVLFEDSAALAGLIIAATGIWLSQATGDARIDGIASIAIGLILAAVDILLAREARRDRAPGRRNFPRFETSS